MALHVLAYNLTRVMNLMGAENPPNSSKTTKHGHLNEIARRSMLLPGRDNATFGFQEGRKSTTIHASSGVIRRIRLKMPANSLVSKATALSDYLVGERYTLIAQA